MKCPVCGVDFEPPRKAGPPRITCGAECARVRELARLHGRKKREGPALPPRRSRTSLPPDEALKRDRRICEAIRDGVGTGAIQERFGVSKQYVYDCAARNGVEMGAGMIPFGSPG